MIHTSNRFNRRTLLQLAAAGAALPLSGGLARLARAEGPIKTAAIYTVPVEQQWVSRIHKAAGAAKERGDIDYAFSEKVSNTDYERVMREYCEAGHQLIVGEAFAVEDAARAVARDYPDRAFLIGSSFKPDAAANPNFAVFDNYIQDASYLSGLIAGAMTKSGKIGMVGGYPIPEVNRLMNAFMAGVRETRPDASFLVAFIGSWFDPPKAKETALAQVDAGADLLYAERFGVSDAAKERGVLAVGNVIDTQADYPDTVVASALWHFEPTLDAAIAAIKAGSFKADDYGAYSFMKAGGCSLAPLGSFDAKVPAEVKAKVAETEAAIKAGTFTVAIDDGEPKSSLSATAVARPASPDGGRKTVLRLTGISKRFGALLANDGISLELGSGEILGLLGENGAGKTTLMNILFGHYLADSGTIEVNGAPLAPGDPKAALAAGIGMVHQHFTLAENLSVLDNVVLGTESLWRPVSRRDSARARLRQLGADYGLGVDPDAAIATLSVGERQRVEILKALYRDTRILIMDEPTAVLTPQESAALFDTLNRFVERGLSIIFISHKLNEILAVCRRVAILRSGRLVAERGVDGVTRGELAALMIGRDVPEPKAEPLAPGPVVLQLAGVSAERGRQRIDAVDCVVREGEILGIAGVSGNGQAVLSDVVAGVLTPSSGRMSVGGRAVDRNGPRAMIERGVARIPEDRHAEGLIGDMSVTENVISESYRSGFSRWGFIDWSRARRRAEEIVAAYDVRCPSPEAPVRRLSGGNMQKLILGRVLDAAPRLVLANQPTRGLDVGAVAYVHGQLIAARSRGAAILLISEDLDELLALSDRISVAYRGRLSAPLARNAVTIEALGLLMAGHGFAGTGEDAHAA